MIRKKRKLCLTCSRVISAREQAYNTTPQCEICHLHEEAAETRRLLDILKKQAGVR